MSVFEGFQQPIFDPSKYKQSKLRYHLTPLWAKAEEIAKITGDDPGLWLRRVKSHPVAIQRALDNLKELHPRNPGAYFNFLFKEYKREEK